ncbi:MAG: hypothetical protein ACTHKR_07205 [Sphingomonas sp.]
MKTMDDMHVPVHLEDIRARLDFMGFTLEDVVKAGLYRLGRVSAKIGRWADQGYYPAAYLTTANWRDGIEDALACFSEDLAWDRRTFLKTLLTHDSITPQELSRANGIIEVMYAQLAAEEREEEAADKGPPPLDQLNLDV